MKLIKKTLGFLLPLAAINVTQAQIIFEAPFQNIEVLPGSKIYVNYKFNPAVQVLVCKADASSDAITSVEWIYKDVTRKIGLPVTLKDNTQFQGHYADPSGKLSITNEYGSSHATGSIFVSCNYEPPRK